MTIAGRIQSLRKSKGLSQEDLADKIGVSRQAVSKWESEQSFPEIDKIILLSDCFEVTTDYLLKGAEPTPAMAQTEVCSVNANMFAYIATALNFIGLIVTWAAWHETQSPGVLIIGIIFMTIGCMIFGIGMASSTRYVEQATRTFWSFNIWLLVFVPLSVIYNALFSFTIAPYPLVGYGALPALFLFGLVYIAICLGVIFLQGKGTQR